MKENSCLILPYVPANSDYKIHAVGWAVGKERRWILHVGALGRE
jgi:hypothetical protein